LLIGSALLMRTDLMRVLWWRIRRQLPGERMTSTQNGLWQSHCLCFGFEAIAVRIRAFVLEPCSHTGLQHKGHSQVDLERIGGWNSVVSPVLKQVLATYRNGNASGAVAEAANRLIRTQPTSWNRHYATPQLWSCLDFLRDQLADAEFQPTVEWSMVSQASICTILVADLVA
jgi:hypothetical protein